MGSEKSGGLRERMRDAISTYEGIPTVNGLSELLGADHKAIGRRLDGQIAGDMETAGRKWIGELPDERLMNEYRRIIGSAAATDYALELVKGRADSILGKAIGECGGIPTIRRIARDNGFPREVVGARWKDNPDLRNMAKERGGRWISEAPDGELLGGYREAINSARTVPGGVKKIRARVAVIMRRAIEESEGIPTPRGLSKKLGLSEEAVLPFLRKGKSLGRLMERRGRAWIKEVGDGELLRKYSETVLSAKETGYALGLVHERLDGIILKTIGESGGCAMQEIAGKLGICESTVERRIGANRTLWMAHYKKRGLSPDQAVELALGKRAGGSPAFIGALLERMRHLSAYREIAGTLRCFSDLMEGTVRCISFYPGILEKVAGELGIKIESEHIPASSLEGCRIAPARAIVVQGIHRLNCEELTSTFRKIGGLYREAPELRVIATHSTGHHADSSFLEAMESNGLVLDEGGTIRIRPPGNSVLEGLGVPPAVLGRLRKKVSLDFNVLVFRCAEPGEGNPIPPFRRMRRFLGREGGSPEAIQTDVPEGVTRTLSARLYQVVPKSNGYRFMVGLEERGSLVALVGSGMHPAVRNAIEVERYPGSPGWVDYRELARRMVLDRKFREKLRIKPWETRRVQRVGLGAALKR